MIVVSPQRPPSSTPPQSLSQSGPALQRTRTGDWKNSPIRLTGSTGSTGNSTPPRRPTNSLVADPSPPSTPPYGRKIPPQLDEISDEDDETPPFSRFAAAAAMLEEATSTFPSRPTQPPESDEDDPLSFQTAQPPRPKCSSGSLDESSTPPPSLSSKKMTPTNLDPTPAQSTTPPSISSPSPHTPPKGRINVGQELDTGFGPGTDFLSPTSPYYQAIPVPIQKPITKPTPPHSPGTKHVHPLMRATVDFAPFPQPINQPLTRFSLQSGDTGGSPGRPFRPILPPTNAPPSLSPDERRKTNFLEEISLEKPWMDRTAPEEKRKAELIAYIAQQYKIASEEDKVPLPLPLILFTN